MRNTLLSPRSLHTDLAALFLRLIFGGMFIYAGWMKISAYDVMLGGFGKMLGLGPVLELNLVIFAEFVCGILIVIGLVTRLAVIPILITMIVAFFVAHANDLFVMKQLPFVYMLLCLVVFILGSGRYSLDRLVFKNRA